MDEKFETITPAEETENDGFVFVVHGFAPEFYENFAFRVDKSCRRRTKELICPYCGRVFEKVDASIKVEVLRFSSKLKEPLHSYKSCKLCRRIVGVRFA
jgi:hypothetical protein